MSNTQDTVWISARGKAYSEPESGRVEFIRADTLRKCFAPRLWQVVVQEAMRTPGISAPAIKHARTLIEENRNA